MAAVNLINYFELIAINPSHHGCYYFLLSLKDKEINFETLRVFNTEHIEAKLEESQNT